MTGTVGNSALHRRMKEKMSSPCFSLEWIMMPSAPPLVTYAFARRKHSSSPKPAMRASKRAKIMKSSVSWAALPERIFSQKTSTSSRSCTLSVPKREFCFRPVLSSMTTPETPRRSNFFTVKAKISFAPPVSPSYKIGFLDTSKTSSTICRRSEVVTVSMSGLPLIALEVSDEDQRQSKVTCFPSGRVATAESTTRAEKPLWASMALTMGFSWIMRRNAGSRDHVVLTQRTLAVIAPAFTGPLENMAISS
mmetsp:Transcript_38091/g.81968  ORF Transcript_38091/g.81968 Transcript_38091/m.81968 type:complete len:250 (+) Transcript_38091:331-1080(+)